MSPACAKLRVKSDADTSSTRLSATCAATSVCRSRPRGPVPVADVAFSVAPTSGRDARSAGTRPARMAAATESVVAKIRLRPSSPLSNATGYGVGGTNRFSRPDAQFAATRPPAHPAADSSRLSTSSCRTMRPREAPTARRTAISRWRPAARTRSRPATFAHAMSSTSPTITIRMPNTGNSSVPAPARQSGTARTPRSLFVSG